MMLIALPSVSGEISAALLLAAFMVAFAESAFGLGAVLPGETFIAGLGLVIADWRTAVLAALFVIGGAVAGDHFGYTAGRYSRLGRRTSQPRKPATQSRRAAQWRRVETAISSHGFGAVLVSRWLPGVRTLVPVVAGAARFNPPCFALASLCGATVWAAWWLAAGVVTAEWAASVGWA